MKQARLYAVQFADGRIKFGQSRSIISRWQQISKQGDRPIKMICSPPIEDKFTRAESEMLVRARRMFVPMRGNEWFCGGSFGMASNLVRQAYGRYGERRCGWREFHGVFKPEWKRPIRIETENCVVEIKYRRLWITSEGQTVRLSMKVWDEFIEELTPVRTGAL